MQISASTLLASQQVAQLQAKPSAGFPQALEKASAFQSLSLKQIEPAEDSATSIPPAAPKIPQKLGSTIDLKI